jgi:hypothetical protein
MEGMMKKIFYLLVLLSLVVSSAGADGVAVELIAGNTVVPVQNDNIRMVSEEVRISDDTKVVADFTFENLSENQVAIKMGFPVTPGTGTNLKFKAWVQGRPVKVDQRQMGGKGELVLKDEISGFTLDMFVWDISFQKKERIQVRVEYDGEWGSDPRTYPEQNFVYITKTGALWHGNIGKADFYMKLPIIVIRELAEKNTKLKLNIKPSGYIFKNNQIEWHFLNWKPSEDIEVSLLEEAPTGNEAAQSLAQYFKDKTYEGNKRHYTTNDIEYKFIWGDRISLNSEIERRLFAKAFRNEIYARHGRIFTTPEMKLVFERLPWYKPRADFKEAELNAIEKKNVEFILEYEKKMGWK